MELLLNIVWLAIALTAFARLASWSRTEPDRRRVAAAFVATACVVALLFPIISITDDLSASVAAVEEMVAVRRVMAAAAQLIVAVALTLVAFVHAESFALPAAPTLTQRALRGPPSKANAHARRHDEGMKIGLQRTAPSFDMRLERRLHRRPLRFDARPPAAA